MLGHSVVVGDGRPRRSIYCVMVYVNYEVYKYRIYETDDYIRETVPTGAPSVDVPLNVAADMDFSQYWMCFKIFNGRQIGIIQVSKKRIRITILLNLIY